MRPRELVVSGFRSYEAETRFCWADRSLVGIVGPIGSGKSSILDAISFALYNQTPRVGRDTRSLINQRRDAAQVSLTFDVDGSTYKAVRSLRRNGASAHAVYRVDDGTDVPLAEKATEAVEVVETLLGLDFSAFQRSVLLAQNQFARFLEATKGDRDQVLKGVFGFDRLDAMRAVARDRLAVIDGRLAGLTALRTSAAADGADLADKRAELTVLEERASTLEALRAPFEETKDLIEDAERRRQAAVETLARLDQMAVRIPDKERADQVLAESGDAGERVAAAEEALRAASAVREEAAAALDAALAGVGGREGLTRAGDLVAAWRAAVERADTASADLGRAELRLAEARERSAAVQAEVAAAEEEARLTAAAEAEAVAAVERADDALQAARQSHRAHAVRADLVVGEPCPVCEQTVAVLPDAAQPSSIEEAEAAAGAARTARADASVAARDAADRLAMARAGSDGGVRAIEEAESGLAAAREARDAAAAAVDAAAAEVAGILGEGDPAEALSATRERSTGAEHRLAEATSAESTARAALEEARTAARGADGALGSLRSELASLSGALGLDVEIGDGPESIGAALHTLRSEWIERRAAADATVASTGDEVEAATAALAELRDAADLGASDELADVVAAAVAERSAKEAEVALLEKRVADLARLASEEADLIADADRLRRIHGDLAPAKFLGYVLDERRRVLGDLASEHFETLSAGRYRFDESGEFQVVDLTAANAVRAPASLSGGETFLASLALALALAEIVSREGGRLDAFFLDEGFGSLDPEHLDLAMSGVERLVTTGPDRLVVVVSHVPALNDRIEDLIVLDRDPITGDTRVVSGSGCG